MTNYTFHPKWVNPFYLKLMKANFLQMEGNSQLAFIRQLKAILPDLTDNILREMLFESWRPAKVAAWAIGFQRLSSFTDLLGQELLNKPYYAEHLCLALARNGNDTAITSLHLYLEEYLVPPKNVEDVRLSVDWALAALIWLDRKENRNDATHFMKKGGPWELFLEAPFQNINKHPAGDFFSRLNKAWKENWQVEAKIATIEQVMKFCRVHFD